MIATAFWGVTGFLVGVIIAFQLAFPSLNFEWAQGYANFGRLRPLHTSAVIFAFGGNALICQLFLCCAAHQSRRGFGAATWVGSCSGAISWLSFWRQPAICWAQPNPKNMPSRSGMTDWWLTIVWLAYLAVFVGTLVKRKEPHIYVANWFYLSFIITVAMLHVFNNLSIPVSMFGSKSVQVFSGVQDAMVQWWYGHNAVGFFLTAGFLGMMYYFVPKQAERPVFSATSCRSSTSGR